nr:hypothetical protein [Tanacetum cinerariifolium]
MTRIVTCGELEYSREFVSRVEIALQVTDTGCRLFPVGASFTQGIVSNIPIGGSISLEGFLVPILLLVVIIVMVVIVIVVVTVILVVIVAVKVVIVIVGVVVVVGDAFSILKLSFVIIGFLCRIVFYYLLHQSLGYGNSFFQGVSLGPGFLLGLSAFAMAVACASRTAATSFVISCQMAASVIAGVADADSSGDIVNLIGDEDPTDEDGDTEVSVSLGEISLEGKKSWDSNISDSYNTGDGGKTAGIAIITWGGEIALYACMASIYRSSCKDEKISMSKRYLVKSFEELGELFLGSLRILFEQRIAVKGYRGGSGK